jgi:hypothetical protein
MPRSPQYENAFATLRRFMPPPVSMARCELCSAALAANHQHLIAPTSRQLLCACAACAVLFSTQGGRAYRRMPQRGRCLPDFCLTDGQWESLRIPIGLAFFFHSTPAAKVMAIYPSPAGPIESLLELESWEEMVQHNPVLREMEPDVEALLVNRVGSEPACYLVPLDACYKLVGLIRASWQGLSGGTEMWQAIEQFFAELPQRPDSLSEASRA